MLWASAAPRNAPSIRRKRWRKDYLGRSCGDWNPVVSSVLMSRKLSFSAKYARAPAGNPQRELGDLVSVGPATVRALHSLGVRSVAQLARCNADSLYDKLCRLRGRREDPCCLDVFAAAVAQARDSGLPAEKRVWWYWSQQRKAKSAAGRRARG